MNRSMLILLLLPLCLLACDDDDCPQCPTADQAPLPTLENIWPHADGTGWIYDLAYRQYETLEPSPEAPPLPSMEELHAALQEAMPGTPVSEDAGLYRLQFDGTVTTESGVTAQNLVGTFYDPVAGGGARSVHASRRERDFLALLARARPDLRAAIEAKYGVTADRAKDLQDAREPFFLGAYAFAYEDSGYYAYGDVDPGHAWTYLEGDLSVGSEFTLQLVPDLADDVWLHGRVWSVGDRSIGGREWKNALEHLYVVDLGITEVIDEGGTSLGEVHPYFYGHTIYVPEVGPVACRERHLLGGESVTQDSSWSEEYHCVRAP